MSRTEDLLCQLCKKILTRSSLDSHMLAHIVYKHLGFTESDQVKCFDCNQTFLSIVSAKKHYKDMHMADKNGNKFLCKFCNEDFEVQYSLKQHVKDIHPEDLVPLSISRESEKNSVEKTIGNQLKLNENGRIDCLTCKKTFASFANAKQHFSEQHEANQKFTCDLCGKIYKLKRDMKSHRRKCHQSTKKQATKSIEKPDKIHGLLIENSTQSAKPNKDEDLTCNVCNKSFAIKDHMNRHMRDSHLSSSHGLKPNENGRIDCLTCDKTFANFTNAKRHFREIHAVTNKKLTCDLRGKIFNVKRNMKSHSRKCHQNASLKNQSLVIDRKNVEFNDEKHEVIEGEHMISSKKQATKSIEKPEIMHGLLIDNSKQNAKLTEDEENEERCVVEKGIDFVTSETFDEDFLKTVECFEKASELVLTPTPVNQNKLKTEVKVEEDLHLVHDDSKQNAKLTEGEENEKLKEEMYFDEESQVHEELGIAFVTSNAYDREYLKGTKSIEKPEKSHILCHKCRKPFASCKKWCQKGDTYSGSTISTNK